MIMSRQIWMFPRAKRRMPPLETALILRAMVVASDLGETWGREQEQQNNFSSLLNSYGLKKGGKLQDEKSGGARTYESQMTFFGFLHKAKDGKLKLTQAGEDLVAFNETAKTFEYQILKSQFPSAYSMAHNVGLDRSIKIRPFVFLLKLAEDPELNGLSDKDMAIPVVFGKSAESFDRCKQLILKFREEGAAAVIPDDESIRTRKTQSRTYDERLEDIFNIANTFKNVLLGAGLVDLRMIEEQARVFPKQHLKARIAEIDALPFVDFIGLPAEQAVLQLGKRFGAVKDTRRTFMPSKAPELFTKESLIYQKFLDEVPLPLAQGDLDLFSKRVAIEFGISIGQVQLALQPILINSDQYTGSKLIELSMGGKETAEAFEKMIAKVFEVEFGFDAEWTGRKKREKTGGYSDIFVVEIDRNLCGIIDAKSTQYYKLPHEDYTKAVATYIDAASELYGSRNLDLKFVGYASHLITSGAKTRAMDIYQAKGIPVCLLSAYGLNSMRGNPKFKNNTAAVTDLLSRDPVNLIA
jgi:hypothetical protein